MTELINANKLSEIVKESISGRISDAKKLKNISRNPKLVIISASDDASSKRYVNNKIKTGQEYGIDVENIIFDKDKQNADIMNKIETLNKDKNVDAIILQLPIYDHLNETLLLNSIDYDKDVDGLTMASIGSLETIPNYIPCTPLGVMVLLEANGIDTEELTGLNTVVVGRGQTSGAPMSTVFRNLDCNVITLHSKTTKEDLEFHIKHADIVISCVGKRHLITADWFKKDCIVIGVGFTYDEQGKQHLDFEVDKVLELGKAKMVTNRVNATGKATVIGLLLNTVLAFEENA